MFSPSLFTQGDSVSFNVVDGQSRTSDIYALEYSLRGAAVLTVAGTTYGTGWNVALTPAQSATLTPGIYSYAIALTKSGERWTIESGELTVSANINAQAAGYDGRTQAEIDLAAVRAEIRARISGGATMEYSIGNRMLRKEPTTNLLALEKKLKMDVNREQMAKKIALGIGSPRNIYVRFGGV